MRAGTVYILSNPSFKGLLKVGRTTMDAEERAAALWTSGVPTPFEVVFEVFTDKASKVETETHKYLSEYRLRKDREFFRVDEDSAVAALIFINDKFTDEDLMMAAFAKKEQEQADREAWIKHVVEVITAKDTRPFFKNVDAGETYE